MKYIACLALMLMMSPAFAAESCGKDAPGISRTIVISGEDGFLYGQGEDPKLGLKEKEIVLTFDDGPVPGSTEKILKTLGDECLKATFFLVGENAAAHPDLAKRIARAGHTVGFHSWSHKRFSETTDNDIEEEVAKSIVAVEKALAPDYIPSNFFRVPFLDSSETADYIVYSHGLVSIGASHMISDWTDIPPQQVHDQMMESIRKTKGGVIILHDVHQRTADALPLLLDTFKKEGYKIVHLVPAEDDLLSE